MPMDARAILRKTGLRLSVDPADAQAWADHGAAFSTLAQWRDAAQAYGSAVELAGPVPVLLRNLARCLFHEGELTRAEDVARRALSLDGSQADTWHDLGAILLRQEKYAQARDAHEAAFAIDDTDLRLCNRLFGLRAALWDYPAAWPLYERRWEFADVEDEFADIPRWDGRIVDDLLIYGEQGLGDAIQMLRYLPLVAERAGRVRLHIHPLLRELVAINFPDIILVTREQAEQARCAVPIMNLPGIFATRVADIPLGIYLHAGAGAHPPRQLPDGRRLNIGLVWSGNPRHKHDGERSMPLAQLAPLLATGHHFHSLNPLQADQVAREGRPNLTQMVRMGEGFHHTADQLAKLDLVISVDSGPAHLAGAMGWPVWLLLAKEPDWRWGLDRDDSPWYPTMRLFRQAAAGDWQPVITRMVAELPAA